MYAFSVRGFLVLSFKDDVIPCLLLPSFVVLTTFDFSGAESESEAAITCDSAPHRRVANDGGIIHQRRSGRLLCGCASRYAMVMGGTSFNHRGVHNNNMCENIRPEGSRISDVSFLLLRRNNNIADFPPRGLQKLPQTRLASPARWIDLFLKITADTGPMRPHNPTPTGTRWGTETKR